MILALTQYRRKVTRRMLLNLSKWWEVLVMKWEPLVAMKLRNSCVLNREMNTEEMLAK